MAAKNKKEKPKGRLVPKEIQIKLTKDQCLQRGNQAAQASKELTEIEEAFKEEETVWKQQKAAFKAKQKNLQDSIKKLLVEVKNQAAESTEDVLLVLNHERGVAEYYYPPEGKDSRIVEERPLEDNERQLSLVEDQANAMSEAGQEIAE